MKALIDFYKLQPIQGHKEWVGYKIEHIFTYSLSQIISLEKCRHGPQITWHTQYTHTAMLSTMYDYKAMGNAYMRIANQTG